MGDFGASVEAPNGLGLGGDEEPPAVAAIVPNENEDGAVEPGAGVED